MTAEQIQQFLVELKQIRYYKGRIKEQELWVKTMSNFNKNGSHDKAILEAVNRLNDMRDQLKLMLKGLQYSEWNEISKKLHALMNKKVIAEKVIADANYKILSIDFNI